MDADERADRIAAAQAIVADFSALCHRCRAGFYGECIIGFDPLADCCERKRTFEEYGEAIAMLKVLEKLGTPKVRESRSDRPASAGDTPAPAPARDSGYIHPDAWRFTKDIGDFRDPLSTGRKLAADLYPITVGLVCEWAYKKDCGGGVIGIVGCTGHPASDIHHGPDKNTLDNEKVSRGVGTAENIWLLCSFCHNAWHALNDEFYPPYDRVLEQDRPWLPVFPADFTPLVMIEATVEEIMAEETRRRREHERHGVKRSGRGGRNDDRPDDGIVVDEPDE